MSSQRASFAAVLGCAFVLAFATLALLGSAPDNVIVRGSSKLLGSTAATLAPQGWGFFTRDAREVTDSVWIQGDHGWIPLPASNGTDARYMYGADRSARNLSVDIEWIASQAKKDRWRNCGVGSVDDCLKPAPTPAAATAAPEDPRLCGELAVVRTVPIPWSYAPFTRDHKHQAQLMEVQCLPS